jgi:aspartyl-tRNA synthetase
MKNNQAIKIADYTKDTFGDYAPTHSTFHSFLQWTPLAQVAEHIEGEEVLIRARLHNARSQGNSCFIVLREGYETLQACAFKSDAVSRKMIAFMASTPHESIVDVVGKVSKTVKPIVSCTQQAEVHITIFFVVNRAVPLLPFKFADASRNVIDDYMDDSSEENNDDLKEGEINIEGKKNLPKME